jgi:hypothetical protein
MRDTVIAMGRVGCIDDDIGIIMQGHFGPCESAGHRPVYAATTEELMSDYDELDQLFDTDPLLVLQRCRRAEQRLAELEQDGDKHIIQLDAEGWIIKHSLACRESGDLFNCEYNEAARLLEGQPHGRYEIVMDEHVLVGLRPLP